MVQPIFLDANVPMYADGRQHPLKQPCVDVLTLVALHPARFFTDAEVFQEILHRYLAIGRWADSDRLFASFAQLMSGHIEDVAFRDVQQAAAMASLHPPEMRCTSP